MGIGITIALMAGAMVAFFAVVNMKWPVRPKGSGQAPWTTGANGAGVYGGADGFGDTSGCSGVGGCGGGGCGGGAGCGGGGCGGGGN